jgi:hypothetical protein
MFEFGPDRALIGTINDAAGTPASTGAILWGLGIAEVKTARRLAKYGIPSLQVRIGGDAFYDNDKRIGIQKTKGIEYSRAAMDHLCAERGTTSFILMGNCATANLCFASALADPRVTGLILTNPHVDSTQVLAVSVRRKILSARTWRYALTGRLGFRKVATGAWQLAARKLRKRTIVASDTETRVDPGGSLPYDVGPPLRQLSDRGVFVLIACAEGDDSYDVLTKRHGERLRMLQEKGTLTFETVKTSSHVFSTDDAAASLLNETISRWVETKLVPQIENTRSRVVA